MVMWQSSGPRAILGVCTPLPEQMKPVGKVQ